MESPKPTQPTVQYTLSHNPEWPLASSQTNPLFTWLGQWIEMETAVPEVKSLNPDRNHPA
jgi:hypothetical protein